MSLSIAISKGLMNALYSTRNKKSNLLKKITFDCDGSNVASRKKGSNDTTPNKLFIFLHRVIQRKNIVSLLVKSPQGK